jgi:hypothetical protein
LLCLPQQLGVSADTVAVRYGMLAYEEDNHGADSDKQGGQRPARTEAVQAKE